MNLDYDITTVIKDGKRSLNRLEKSLGLEITLLSAEEISQTLGNSFLVQLEDLIAQGLDSQEKEIMQESFEFMVYYFSIFLKLESNTKDSTLYQLMLVLKIEAVRNTINNYFSS